MIQCNWKERTTTLNESQKGKENTEMTFNKCRITL